MTTVAGAPQIEESRIEGAAARWRFPHRTVLHAASGASAQAVADLIASHSDRVSPPAVRPLPPADLDTPRGWRSWAAEVAGRTAGDRTVVRFLSRQAVVVGPDRWSVITTPQLVRVEMAGPRSIALLAVWDHPRLGRWLLELAEPPPARAWQPPSGLSVPVLFASGTAGIVLHELIGHPAESDLVLVGDSPLAQLRRAAVTAASIQIVDDPSRFDLPGAFTRDDEGAPATPQTLVRDGLLEGWLCDRQGSERLAAPAGRGRRASWAQPPRARLSNLVVAAGATDPEALVADLSHGLVVSRLGAATVDPVSKRLVLHVERGWEVRHGRRRRPLAAFALTGGALEVAAHLEPSLGSDPTPDWRLGWCVKDGVPIATGSEAPSILAHRLEVL